MSSHLADSAIYGHLWTTPELHDLFDDRGRTSAWLTILAALAQAQADVGLVPAEAAALIAEHATIDRLDLGGRRRGHPLLRALDARADQRTSGEILPDGGAASGCTTARPCRTCPTRGSAGSLRTVGDVVERDLARCRRRAPSRSPVATATR